MLSLYRENSKVILAHELSFQMMDSKVLGFFYFLPGIRGSVTYSKAKQINGGHRLCSKGECTRKNLTPCLQ